MFPRWRPATKRTVIGVFNRRLATRPRGAMLVLTLMLLTLLWFSLLIFSSSTLQALKTSANYLGSERASSTAEAGILYGIEMLKADPAWRPKGATTKMKYTDEKFRLDVYDAASAPEAIPSDALYLRSVGQSRTGQKRTAVAVVKIGTAQGGVFDYAFVGKDIDLNGGVRVDAYNSLTGRSVAGGADVATTSKEEGAMKLNSGVVVDGVAWAPPNANVTSTTSSPGRTWGTDNVIWKNWSAITVGEKNLSKALDLPAVQVPAKSKGDDDVKVNWKGAELSPGSYADLKMSGGGVAKLAAGSYYFDSVDIAGGATLSVPDTEPVVIYIRGELKISNGTTSNNSRLPRNLIFVLDPDADVSITGGSQVYGLIYAPKSEVKVTGGSRIFGAIISEELQLSGGPTLSYDVNLRDNPPKIAGLSGSSSGSSGGGGVSIVSQRRY